MRYEYVLPKEDLKRKVLELIIKYIIILINDR